MLMPSVPAVSKRVSVSKMTGKSPVLANSEDRADSWQQELASSIRSSHDLLAELGLPEVPLPDSSRDSFPVLVPRSFLRRMEHGNPRDPLLLQVLQQPAENEVVDGFVSDPVGDSAARSAPGLLQKYAGRVLLMTTGTCAVHCRYCFRREYPYDSEPATLEALEPAFAEIRNDSSVTEVILSGGDPLVFSDSRLRKLLKVIDAIEHVQRIRIHTRVPIVIPSRVTRDLLLMLNSLRAQAIMVVHSNHANEIQGACSDALRDLVRTGIPVLNQAVLLKGINDSTAALGDLCETLVNLGIIPYYLHQLDRVNGAAHFEVDDATGLRIVEELRHRLPGYAVPDFVREIEGAESKTPIVPPQCETA